MTLDVIKNRRPPINYESPAVCEVIFTGSSFPELVLLPLPNVPRATGGYITWYGSQGTFQMTWDNYPGALCYTIYKLQDSLDPFSNYVIVAECITDTQFDPTSDPGFDPNIPQCYLIQVITAQGPTILSNPFCTDNNGDGIPDGFPGQPGNLPGGDGTGGGGTCPLITAQPPTPLSRSEGQDATFGPVTSQALGGTLTFHWYKNGVFFRDTTETTQGNLLLGPMEESFAGTYKLGIQSSIHGCGMLFSNNVVLNFIPTPAELALFWDIPSSSSNPGDVTIDGEFNDDGWTFDCVIPTAGDAGIHNEATANLDGLVGKRYRLDINYNNTGNPGGPVTFDFSTDLGAVIRENEINTDPNSWTGVGSGSFEFEIVDDMNSLGVVFEYTVSIGISKTVHVEFTITEIP